jgi:hypothetical protein
MKNLIIACCVGLSFFAGCRQNPENGGEEVRGDEVRSDTPMDMNNLEQNVTPVDSTHMNGSYSDTAMRK